MEKVAEPEKYIRRVMDATGLTVETLAEATGYSARTLKRMMSGEVKLSKFAMGQMEKLAAMGTHGLSKFGSSESMTLREDHAADKYDRMRDQKREGNGISNRPAGDGRAMRMRVVPVLGWAKAGQAVEFEDVVDWDEKISLPVNDEKAFGIRVKGDSMSPRICEGDIVVVSPSEPPRNEKPVVVRLRGQGIMLKQFHRLTATTFELRSLNPFYLPVAAAMTDVVWIYPVIATINYP